VSEAVKLLEESQTVEKRKLL